MAGLASAATLGLLLDRGILRFNHPSETVRGVEPYIDLNVYFGTAEQLVSGVMP